MKKVKGSDLRLRDEIRSFNDSPYNTSTVIKIEEHSVHLFRPYVHTSDFSSTAGVIPYVGFENYSIGKNTEVELLRRNKAPK